VELQNGAVIRLAEGNVVAPVELRDLFHVLSNNISYR
jgi:hypothetical protein